MADNPLAQALFHSQAGRNQWQGSYRLVRNITAGYSALVFLAFFAPEVVSGSSFAVRYSASQVGAFGPAVNRLFWSGRGYWVALRYGSQIGGYAGQTLEESPIGSFAGSVQAFVPWGSLAKAIWNWLSTAFAEGAQNSAIYFEGWNELGPYEGPAWQDFERPVLLDRGIPFTKIPGVPD